MTDLQDTNGEKSATEPNGTGISIDRDPNFLRMVADSALVIDRNFGHEISFIVHGPDPDTQFVDAEGQQISVMLKPSYTEVGRVRLMAPTAITLAMTIVEQSINRDRINIEGFREAINDMLDKKLASDVVADDAEGDGA